MQKLKAPAVYRGHFFMSYTFKLISDNDRYRYTFGRTSNPLVAGVCETKHATGDRILCNLDEFDTEFTKDVKIKEGCKIYRIHHDHLTSYLVALNPEKGLIYFNKPERSEEGEVEFETLGMKLNFCYLLETAK